MSLRRYAVAALAGAVATAASVSCAAPAIAPPAAPAAASAGSPSKVAPADTARMIVSGESITRTVDCAGADVNVAASASTVTLKHCNNIRIAGDHDRVSADLLEDSEILVLGDHNTVRWTPYPGASPYVRDQGKGNVTAPF